MQWTQALVAQATLSNLVILIYVKTLKHFLNKIISSFLAAFRVIALKILTLQENWQSMFVL